MISGPPEMRARRVARLGALADALNPTASSAGLGSAAIVSKSYRVSAECEVGPFSLDDAATIIVHRGSLALRLVLADVDRRLGIGGLAVIPAGTPLCLRLSDADITVCYLVPDKIPHFPGELSATLEIVTRLDPPDVQLAYLMNCFRDELQAGNPLGLSYQESLGLSLGLRLFGCHARRAAPGAPHRGGLTGRQVQRAKRSIMSDLDKAVPLAALAEEAHLSPSHFSRAFKKSTGLSPSQWRLDQRFAMARDMIADEGKTITSIAIGLGFTSLSHFSTAFKRATGLSPSRYRRKGQ